MLQRIQSLFILLVIIISILMYFFPVAGFQADSCQLFITGLQKNLTVSKDISSDAGWIMYFVPVIIILSGFAIFKYKNRLLQIKICRLNILLNIVLIVSIFYYTDLLEKAIAVKAQYKLGAVLPLFSVAFLYFAIFSIRKDEKLVKSADRLR